MNILKASDAYKLAADKFIGESRLLDVLQKYGRIEYEGAYTGNVMLHGDVDIKVIKDTRYVR